MSTPTPKVGFVSLGCPKALVDSERILTQLRMEGYEVVPTYEDADVVVVNTCGFIDSAKAESLEVIGVGYRVAVKGNLVELSVGFSHPVLVELPEGIQAKAEGQILTISGADKELVGEMAAKIRRIRKPEPYKGKGIKYTTEIIRRKVGKSGGKK